MFTKPDYRTELRYHELRMAQQNARMELTQSHKAALERIQLREELGKDTKVMRQILRMAQLEGITYERKEQMLIGSGRLQAMYNDR